MRPLFIFCGVVALALPSVAMGRIEFAQYEGRNSVHDGNGGTKVVKDGVDFWTTGDPPRKYQVVGIITDSRKDKLLSGHAVGSSAIIKKVREAGADGVILIEQNSAFAGTNSIANLYGSDNSAFVTSSGRAVHQITTRFIVVKYLAQ